MKEFMLLIRNTGEHVDHMQPEEHESFLRSCESYIGKLKANNQLIAAQPLAKNGTVIRKTGDQWTSKEVTKNEEIQVGYYHIYAGDIEEAISIAKENPEFAFTNTASIEVRPIKTKEQTTGFEYPK